MYIMVLYANLVLSNSVALAQLQLEIKTVSFMRLH